MIRSALWVAAVFVLVIISGAASALDFPKLTGRVIDNAGLISDAGEARLDALLKQHEEKTSNQVVIATLASLQGTTIEDFGYQLGRHWGIGKKGRDNGLLLIVAPNERKVRIEVGYGLEGTMTDVASKTVIDGVIVPKFKAGQFEDGISAGVQAIVGILEGNGPEWGALDKDESLDAGGVLFLLLLFGFFALAIWTMYRNRDGHSGGWDVGSGRRRLRGSGGSGFGGGGFSGGGGGFGGGGGSGGW
jgi:uncharacterized protein